MRDITPEQFAEMIAGATDEQVEGKILEIGVDRTLDRIFAGFEERFRPERAQGVEAAIQWRIETADGVRPYTVHIGDGACSTARGEVPNAKTTLTIKLVPFVRLITGQADAMRLLMTRKLKVSGDLMFAQKMQTFFNRPSS